MAKLFLVPTPIGNLDDITLRAIRVLKEASVILAEDTRNSAFLLKHHGITTPLLSHHQWNEHRQASRVAGRVARGENVALITDAGTPGISDPGFLLVRTCVELGIATECLPGATAFVPAVVNSGFPCDRFCFEGFLPRQKGRQKRLLSLAGEERTMVFLESPFRLVKALEQMAACFGEQRRGCVAREISKVHEEYRRGSLGELIAHFSAAGARGEIVILVEGRDGSSPG